MRISVCLLAFAAGFPAIVATAVEPAATPSAAAVKASLQTQIFWASSSPADLASALAARVSAADVPADAAAARLLSRALTDPNAVPMIERWLEPDAHGPSSLAALAHRYHEDPARQEEFARALDGLDALKGSPAGGALDALRTHLDSFYLGSRPSEREFMDASNLGPDSQKRGLSLTKRDLRSLHRRRDFDLERQRDFPNLFQSARDPRRETERALATIFQRLVVPVFLPGEKEPRAVRFFALAQKMARDVGPHARVVPSGGVVRSALGFLYDAMLRAAETSPETFSASAFLNDVAEGRHPLFDKNGNVMAFDVRGVGSDFDVLLDCDGNQFEKISRSIQDLFIDKEAARLDKREDPDDMNKAFYTIADLKPLVHQVERSTRQGGAAIDLLVFDMDRGVLVEPPTRPGIVDDFFRGYYRYLPPAAGSAREDAVTTTMRGPRALVELPFLRLHPEDEETLNDELRKIRRDIEAGLYPSEKAIQQINKLRRNGRLSMANNAVIRAPATTTLGLVRSIADALEERRLAQLLTFPTKIRFESYTPRYPLNAARARRSQELPPILRKRLIDRETFLRDFTADGSLYHGTSGQDALGALRGGFRQTDYEMGVRRGTYSTWNPGMAQTYAHRKKGDVAPYLLRLPIEKDAPFVAFDSRSLSSQEVLAFRGIESEAKAHGLETAYWLARRYGVDFIVLSDEQVVLIKNTEALKKVTLPSLVKDTVESLNQDLDAPDADFARLLTDRKRLEVSKPLFKALDIDIGRVPSFEELSAKAVLALPRMTDPVKILLLYDALPRDMKTALPRDAFGGKTLAQTFAAALASDPELSLQVFPRGYGNPYLGFDKVAQDPEWPPLFVAMVSAMRDNAANPALPAERRFLWLEAIQCALDGARGVRGIYDEAIFAQFIASIPEETFATIRAEAARQPTHFDRLYFVAQGLGEIAGKPVDLTSVAIASRLKLIADAKNVPDQLTHIQLIGWATDIAFGNDNRPDVLAAIARVVPRIKTDDELFHRGTDRIWSAIVFNKAYEIGPEERALAARTLRTLLANHRSLADLKTQRDDMALIDIATLVTEKPEKAGPEVVALLKQVHEKYRLDVAMPGYWPKLKKLFGL